MVVRPQSVLSSVFQSTSGYVYIILQPDANELKEIHICLFKLPCVSLF